MIYSYFIQYIRFDIKLASETDWLFGKLFANYFEKRDIKR